MFFIKATLQPTIRQESLQIPMLVMDWRLVGLIAYQSYSNAAVNFLNVKPAKFNS